MRHRVYLSVFVLLPLGIAFLAAEIAVRLFSPEGFITPEILSRRQLQYASAVFARTQLPLRAQNLSKDNRPLAYINSKGYRGEEFETQKPVGTTRILIYGGSSTYDIHARLGQDWPHLTEIELRNRGFSGIQVINAGIPGQASFDSFGRLFAEGHLLSPDYVLFYQGWNDIKMFDNSQPLIRKISPFREDKDPLYHYQNRWDRLLCEISQLYVRLRYRFILWRYNAGLEGVKPRGKASEISETAVEQFRLTLEAFVDFALSIHATPVLMLEARLIHRNNTTAEKAMIQYDYQPLTEEILLKASERVESVVRSIAKEKHAVLIDASTPMSGNKIYFQDHIHPNTEGSKKLAQITAEGLAKLLGEGKLQRAVKPN